MRAIIQWLALAPALVLAGCSTFHPPPSADFAVSLSREDAGLAEALAHYSQALISENTLGESQAALDHFRKAAASDPYNLPLSLKVAADYIGRKDYAAAIAVLRRVLRFHPESVESRLLLGISYQAQSRFDEAVREYRIAIRMAPDRVDGYVRLATLHVIRLAPRKALSVVESGMDHLANPAPLFDFCEAVGRIYLAGKDVEGGTRFLEPVFLRSQNRDESGELLGHCYAILGRDKEAAKVFETLLMRKPGNSQLALVLGECYERLGDAHRAESAYREALKGQPYEPMAAVRLANLEMSDSVTRGLTTLEEASEKHPDDLRLHVSRALTYMRLERYENAVAQFDWIARSMERDAAMAKTIQPLFFYWYGQACERAGRPADGERYIARYLTLVPDSGEALNYLAYMWAEQGRNLDKAMDYVTRALKADPENGAYLDTLGWIYFKLGNPALALKHLTRALKMEGDDPAIYDHLGDAWMASQNREKAVRMWKKSLMLDPANHSVRGKLIRENIGAGSLPPVPAPKPSGAPQAPAGGR